ncbi:MAG: long-chain fatty acid--CoA ligase [Propionibacteriaceae bacterium]|jgi:long-chain acyl-CoA synthetase|nr:long-chain fatty acid--CoA ligase [Propionibacteriaceae bacterium]
MTTAEEVLAGKPATIPELLDWRIAQTPDKEAFRFRGPDDGWTSIDWAETGRRIERVAAGLLSLGLQYEERVAIICSTRIEWILADLGVNIAGGATTAIYPQTQGEDFEHIVTHSGSVIMFAEDQEQLDKLNGCTPAAQQVGYVILIDGEVSSGQDRVLSWRQLSDRGEKALAADPDLLKRVRQGINGDSLATLVYTSGTTGMPKGVELTHRGWVYEGFAVDRINIINSADTHFLWLPLSHVFGKCVAMAQFAIGFVQAVDGRVDRIVQGLGELKPQVMCGAPRIFEKVRSTVMLTSRTGVKSRIARWAFSIGRASREHRLAGRKLPIPLRPAYALANALVFSKLKQKMGGNVELFISGSAKLSAQVQAWFYSAGILIVEGYGLTETSAISFVTHRQDPRFGTVGPPLPGTQVRIADDGEVLIKGPGVMRGYHKNPELTREMLTDGWFHTGDIGRLDDAGHLIITDRKKDLMKTSGGKYVAPAKVETVIAASVPYVSQVVVVGDGRKYISALMTMDRDNVLNWAGRHAMTTESYETILASPEFRESIERGVDSANARLERWETVKRFAILPTEFSVDDGGVTPSMKIRRASIAKTYADVVDSLYEEEPVPDAG